MMRVTIWVSSVPACAQLSAKCLEPRGAKELVARKNGDSRPSQWRLLPFFADALNFQSFFAVGSVDTFSATPTVSGLSPIVNAVPD